MLIVLALSLVTPATAGSQTTAITGQAEVNLLGSLVAKQAATEAQLAATRKELAAATAKVGTCHQDCPVAPAPAPAPASQLKATAPAAKKPVAPVVIVPDPKIAVLEARIASFEATILALQGQIAAIPTPAPAYDDTEVLRRIGEVEDREIPAPTAPYDDTGLTARVTTVETDLNGKVGNEDFTAATDRLAAVEGKVKTLEGTPGYDDTALTDRVTALETAPPPEPVVHNTTTYESDFYPAVYVTVDATFAAPYLGSDEIVGGRINAGARVLLKAAKGWKFGAALEGGPSAFIGWGIRGGPEAAVNVGKSSVLTFVAGPGYNCEDLGGFGCEAERTGAFAAVGLERSGNLTFGVRLGGEESWVTTSSVPEGFYDFRGFLGVTGSFGKDLRSSGY